MSFSFRRRPSTLIGVPVLAASLGLAGCGTVTVDPNSGQGLIKKDIPVLLKGIATVKSVSCPSDVKPTDGKSFDCKVDILQTSNGSEHRGTITLHIIGGGKQLAFRASDIHAN